MNASFIAAGRSLRAAGPLLMLLGMLMFALNDAMGKWLISTYGLGQLVLLRSVAALLILVPMIGRSGIGGLVTVDRPLLQLARVIFSTAEVFCFYWAVIYLPLADVMTFWLAAPIYVAAASPLLLREKVGWRRWTAIGVGFVGVLIALEPSRAMFTLPAAISIAGSAAFAFMLLSGRSLRGTPDSTLVFFQVTGAGLAGLAIAPFDWSPIASSRDLMLLGLLGIVAMAAHMLVNRALKIADAATIAPLQYTLLLWAVIFGWIFFGDMPRMGMMVGAVLIVASGLFIFVREQTLKKRRSALSAVPE